MRLLHFDCACWHIISGYTFAEVGGALKVTRSDGVDFEISAGAKTGSGDAASDAVALEYKRFR